MADRPFVHLHCHTHYSLLDGASRIPELVQHVKTLGMNAVAMTDHGNLYGAIEFYRECQAAGLNPVIGYEAYVAPNRRTDREPRRASTESDDAIYHHLTLLARDLTDAMYDPKDAPHVPHSRGTELVVEHIEKYWCPTMTSQDLVAALP